MGMALVLTLETRRKDPVRRPREDTGHLLCIVVCYCHTQDTRSSDDQKDDIPVENYVAQRYVENPYLIGGEMAVSVPCPLHS